MGFELGTYADVVDTIGRNKLGPVALFIAAGWGLTDFAYVSGKVTALLSLPWSAIAIVCLVMTARDYQSTTRRIALTLMLALAASLIWFALPALIDAL